MIWIGCCRECRVAVRYATRKQSGPHRSCQVEYQSHIGHGQGTLVQSTAPTHHSHGLHTEHHCVRGHIPRVGQRILFPQLPEQILGRSHVVMVDDKVPFKEAVECARYGSSSVQRWIGGGGVVKGSHTQDKPQDSNPICQSQGWLHVAHHGECQCQKSCTSPAS